MTFNELQQVGSVNEKQDQSEDRALWRTPKRTADGIELDVVMRTCFLSLRYDINQSMTFRQDLHRRRSVLWSTLSNTADSRAVSASLFPVSIADSV